ncbi:MAG: hypothetical protein ACLR7U_08475 [Ruthenibacterium lactatiformans]
MPRTGMMAWNSESRLDDPGRIARHHLTAGKVLGAAVHKFLHAVSDVYLGRERLFRTLAHLVRMLAALLVHQHLLGQLHRLVGLFDEVHFQVVLEELRHGLLNELVGDGFFVWSQLVCVETNWRRKSGSLHVGKVILLSPFLYRFFAFKNASIWLTKAASARSGCRRAPQLGCDNIPKLILLKTERGII